MPILDQSNQPNLESAELSYAAKQLLSPAFLHLGCFSSSVLLRQR